MQQTVTKVDTVLAPPRRRRKPTPRKSSSQSVATQTAAGQASAGYRYLIFYKPYDVLSQFTDSQGDRAILKHFIDVPEVYPVGRLDRDSEGLLLLTDHGRLQHRLSSPQYGHPRTYWVQVERQPDAAALQQLRQGIEIKGQRTRPARVTCLPQAPTLPPRQPPIRYRKSVPTSWLELVLTEGRNRQVRRMTEIGRAHV